MRPDEHKKKKSAQYQRKHGTSAAKGGKNENDKSSAKYGKQGSSGADQTRSIQHNNKVDTSESEEEGQQTEVTTKKFRRREIASNWAKYDLPPGDADDDATTARGQDFKKLLHSAGGAVAHFRFKDEESWEEEGGNADGSAAQVLSLDCAELATSLNCLPLYTQLGLDKDIFTSEQLSAMDNTANESRAMAGLPALGHKKELDSPTAHSKPSPSSSTLPPNCSRGLETSSSLSATSPSTDNRSGKGTVEKWNKEQENRATDRKMESRKETSMKIDGSSSSGGGRFTDTDLDMLLECGGGGGGKQDGGEGGTVRSSEGASRKTREVMEQDLDDLLSMESPQSVQSASVTQSAPKAQESKTAAESAALEDWLDSMLDD